MILVDTSAWVEYLRGTGSSPHRRLRSLLERDAPLATTDPVVMEILAGARDDTQATRLRRMLDALEHRPVLPEDFQEAARIHRTCRGAGATVRSLMDCLVAAVALRENLSVLAWDRDFKAISSHTGLRLAE
jgi:predicted nucleic acid-binding protein